MKQNLGEIGYYEWRREMDYMIQNYEGIIYHGMVNHTELAKAYSDAGFYLYPTTYPETSCVSLMKAQSMGAIPITSRFRYSSLPETTGEFDLGPDTSIPTEDDQVTNATSSSITRDAEEWSIAYMNAVLQAAFRDS